MKWDSVTCITFIFAFIQYKAIVYMYKLHFVMYLCFFQSSKEFPDSTPAGLIQACLTGDQVDR